MGNEQGDKERVLRPRGWSVSHFPELHLRALHVMSNAVRSRRVHHAYTVQCEREKVRERFKSDRKVTSVSASTTPTEKLSVSPVNV